AGVSKVTLPPRKRLCIALGLRYEVGESSSAPTARPTGGFRDEMLVGMPGAPATDETELDQRLTDFITTVRQDTKEIYRRLDDAQDDRSLMSSRLNMLYRDRRAHARTALLMERESIEDYSIGTTDGDCSLASSRPCLTDTAYRDTKTDEYTADTCDNTAGIAGTR
ncbi:hypothetical protein Tco_1302472, partial [Tanacetum coccineum]